MQTRVNVYGAPTRDTATLFGTVPHGEAPSPNGAAPPHGASPNEFCALNPDHCMPVNIQIMAKTRAAIATFPGYMNQLESGELNDITIEPIFNWASSYAHQLTL